MNQKSISDNMTKSERIVAQFLIELGIFWSYVYKNGKIIEHTRIEVEVIHDKDKGVYLRTQKDPTEENNLLELPIWYLNEKWNRC